MKALYLTGLLTFVSFFVYSQNWRDVEPPANIISNTTTNNYVVADNGAVYAIYQYTFAGQSKIVVEEYDAINTSWNIIFNQNLNNAVDVIKTDKANGDIFFTFIAESAPTILIKVYKISNGSVSLVVNDFVPDFEQSTEYDFVVGNDPNEFYWIYENQNAVDINLGVWNQGSLDIEPYIIPFYNNINATGLQLEILGDTLWMSAGQSSTDNRLIKTPTSTIAFLTWDGSANGFVTTAAFDLLMPEYTFLSGNRIDRLLIHSFDTGNNLFEAIYDPSTGLLNTTPVSGDFFLQNPEIASDFSSGTVTYFSNFNLDQFGITQELKVIQKDLYSGAWDIIGDASDEIFGTHFAYNRTRISHSENALRYVAGYDSVSFIVPHIKVFNNAPDVSTAIMNLENTLCASSSINLFTEFSIEDPNFDRLEIVGVTSSDISVIDPSLMSYSSLAQSGNRQYFSVTILAGSTGSTDLTFQITDGYDTIVVTQTVNIGVYDLNSTTDAARCDIGSVDLNATVTNGSIFWYELPGGTTSIFNGDTFTTPSISSTTVYYAEGKDNGCLTTRYAVTATVNTLPTVSAGANVTLCDDGTAVTLSGTGASSYAWDNGVIDGISFLQGVGTITYTVTGTDINGCTNEDQVDVTVNALPTVSAGSDMSICDGASVTLSGTGAVSYTWDNGVIDGNTFTPIATLTYTVTGTDANGCQNTDQIDVIVNSLPPVFAGFDQTICDGDPMVLTGSGASSFVWDNGVSDGISFNPSTTLTYTVTGTDVNGCINTDQVIVTVNALPTVNAGADQTVCDGNNVTVTGSGTAAAYAWDHGVADGVSFVPSATLTYTVTGTDGNGCQNTDQLLVTVNNLPAVNAGSNQSVCDGTSISLSGSGANSYVWDNGITDGVAFAATSSTIYTVTGTDLNGCQNTDQVFIIVKDLPIVNAGSDQDICNGASISLTASGAVSYVWDNGVTNGVAFTPATTLTYTVTGTDADGCQNTDQVTVTVNSLPSVNAGADQTVCAGDLIVLAGSGASNYSWDNSVLDNIAFTAGNTLTYTLTGTDANGCQATDQVVVTVNVLPTVNAGADQTICDGLSVTLNGSGASSYTWDNGVTDGVSFTPGSTATYTVTGTDGNGCQNTDQVDVFVNNLPTVDAGPDQSICQGSSITLSGSGAASYAWDNGVTDGVAFSPSVTQTYTVTGTDGNGCVSSDQITITVNGIPTVNAGADQTTCTGDIVTLTGSGANSYTWDNGVLDGQSFGATTTKTYTVTGTDVNGCIGSDQVVITVNTLPTVNAGVDQSTCPGGSITLNASGALSYVWDNGITDGVAFIPGATSSYVVTGTDANGCQNTDVVTVTVNNLPSVDAGANQSICQGSSITLNGTGAVSYTWDNGVTDGVAFAPATSTVYTVTGIDANGCNNTDQVFIIVMSLPVVDAGSDFSVCDGTPVTLSASGASTLVWDNGVTDGVAFTPASTLTYTVVGTDGNGCQNTDQITVTVNSIPAVNAGADQTVCDGASLILSGSGADTYSWDNFISDGVGFTINSTTTFTVTGTDLNGCQNTDQVIINVNGLPLVDAGVDQTICEGTAVILTASGASTYVWDNAVVDGLAFNPTLSTTYTVTGTDANGCSSTDQVDVFVNLLPAVDAGSDQSICDGTPVNLFGLGANTYSWDNGVTDGVAFNPSSTLTYTVVGTDVNGCQNTDQVTINVNANPLVDAGTDQTVCDGASLILSGSGADSYSWDNFISDGVPFTINTTTTFTVTGTDLNGCSSTDQLTVTVNTLPVVDAGVDQTVCDGTSVTLAASGALTYTWDNSVLDGVAFTPTNSTTYTVVGTDANGCSNTDQMDVFVNLLPAVDAGSDQIICAGTSISLFGFGAGSYAWDNGVTDGVPFTPSSTLTYTVVGTDANGCINTDQVEIAVNALPIVDAGLDFAVCSGTDAILSATGANSYTWDNGVIDGVAFTPGATTTYTVIGIDNAGCQGTDAVTIQITPLPSLTTSGDVTICAEEAVSMTSASTAPIILWFDQPVGGTEIASGNSFTSPILTSSVSYYVEAFENGCSSTRLPINISVNGKPQINISSTSSDCGNNNGTATASINQGTAPYTYYWSSGEQQVFSVSGLTPGSYYFNVEDANGCKAIAVTEVQPSSITLNPTVVNPNCFNAETGSISLNLTGMSGSITYLWNTGKSTTSISGLKAGTYEVTINNDAGCVITEGFTLTQPNPINILWNNILPTCGNNDGLIDASTTTGGTAPYFYAWSNGKTGSINSALTYGAYTLNLTDNAGCVFEETLYLSEKDAPLIQGAIVEPLCNGTTGSIDLDVTPFPGDAVQSVSWSNGANTEDLNNLMAGNYVSFVNTVKGCVAVNGWKVKTRKPDVQPICLVTVDSVTTTNLIVWEKAVTTGISHYNIYRESNQIDDYQLIDTVQYNNISVFNDVVASPIVRSWRYKISAVDVCGTESDLSDHHKTLHLNTFDQGGSGVTIVWDKYEGTNYSAYNLYRYTDALGDWENIATLPTNVQGFADATLISEPGLDYMVEIVLNDTCTATQWRAQDFNTSRSNKEKGVFKPGNGFGNYSNNELFEYQQGEISLQIFPNPFENNIQMNLEGAGKAAITIFDLHGKQIHEQWCFEGNSKIELDGLSSGVYLLKAMIEGQEKTIRIIKQ